MSSLVIWDYGTRESAVNFAALVIICLALFASFVWIGVMVSTLFGRKTEGIGKLYFADLVGAGVKGITRLAVSPRGDQIAFVAEGR